MLVPVLKLLETHKSAGAFDKSQKRKCDRKAFELLAQLILRDACTREMDAHRKVGKEMEDLESGSRQFSEGTWLVN